MAGANKNLCLLGQLEEDIQGGGELCPLARAVRGRNMLGLWGEHAHAELNSLSSFCVGATFGAYSKYLLDGHHDKILFNVLKRYTLASTPIKRVFIRFDSESAGVLPDSFLATGRNPLPYIPIIWHWLAESYLCMRVLGYPGGVATFFSLWLRGAWANLIFSSVFLSWKMYFTTKKWLICNLF